MTNEQQVQRFRRLLSTDPADLTAAEREQQEQMQGQLADIVVDFIMDDRKKGCRKQKDFDAYVRGDLEIGPSGERLLKHIPDVECPQCGKTIRAPLTVEQPKAASSYDECLRKCTICHAGWSNAKSNPVACIDRPTRAVPRQVRTHLNATLASALNERNRQNKANKFCFFTSEDALTWTLFRGLQVEHLISTSLKALLPGLGIGDDTQTTMLLWGSSVPPATKAGTALRDRLIAVCDAVGEQPTSRSEPDVIFDLGPAGLILIEVKLHSGNEVRTDVGVFNRYTESSAFADPVAATRSGYYELVRYWRLGAELAGTRPFFLVNLGPDGLFNDPDESGRWDNFQTGIGTHADRRFVQVRWSEVLKELAAPDVEWLRQFVETRLRR